MNQKVFEEIVKAAQEECEKKLKDTLDKMVHQIADPYERYFDAIMKTIGEKFAEKYVVENYSQIADKINLDRVVKMAELSAVGKTMKS